MSEKRQKQQLQRAPRPAIRPKTQTPIQKQVPSTPEALQRTLEAPIQAASAEDILSLQRTVGNRATQQAVLRQPVARETAPPAAQPLVTAPEGAVQPLFETGLAKGENIKEYVKGTRRVKNKWTTMTPSQRARKLGRLANRRLKALGVPSVTVVRANIGSSSGELNYGSWTLKINRTLVSKADVTEGEMTDLTDTVYHEARHAEQFFRAARWMAGEGKKPAEIADELSIPLRIAKRARRKPLKPLGPLEKLYKLNAVAERMEARAWVKSLGKEGTKKYTQIMDKLEKAEAKLKAARATYKASPSLANLMKVSWVRVQYKMAYQDYRNVVEEKDAWKVGGMAGEAYKKTGKKK